MPAPCLPVGFGKPVRLASVPHERGFTLIELLVTVAVLAVLIAAATPNIVSVVNSNRLTAQANELVTSLQLARTEAVRRNSSISLCRSTDGATCAAAAGVWSQWLTVLDRNDEVLRVNSIKAPVQISSQQQRITFRPDGLARLASGALAANAFTVCIPTATPATNQRIVDLRGGSRISTESADGGGACP
jgi:type IV fimbrial biogenesis protein FimT